MSVIKNHTQGVLSLLSSLLLSSVLLSICIVVNAQEPSYKVIGLESGLLSTTIYKINQDSKGVLWLATDKGVCSYDGFDFKTYESDYYYDQDILALAIGSDNRIWHINLSGKLYFIRNGRVHIVSNFRFSDLPIVDMYIKRDTIWLVFKKDGKFKLASYNIKENGFEFLEEYPIVTHTTAFSLERDTSNSTFYMQQTSDHNGYDVITEVKTGNVISNKKIKKAPSLTGFNLTSTDLILGHSNTELFLIDNDSIVDKLNTSKWFNEVGLNGAKVYDSNYFLFSDNGIQVVSIEEGKLKPNYEFLLDFQVLSIFQDTENSFWIGTRNSGLLYIPDLSTLIYNKLNSGLSSTHVRTITLMESGEIYMGLDNGEIFKSADDNIEFVADGFGSEINRILKKENKIWVASNKNFSMYDLQSNFRQTMSVSSKDICFEDKGDVLISSSSWCLKIDCENYIEKGSFLDSPFVTNRSYAIADDGKYIWSGTVEGLVLIDKEDYSIIDTLLSNNISDIAIGEDGLVFASTFTKGVYRLEDFKVVKHYDSASGLSSSNISDIHYDEEKLYVSTDNGLNIINTQNGHIVYLNTSDGLPTGEINEAVPHDNIIWVATNSGLCKIPKPQLVEKQHDLRLSVNQVSINQKDTVVFSHYDLNSDQRQIHFYFSSPSFNTLDYLDFYYRHSQLDTTWQLAIKNQMQISSLPYGDSKIEVYAIDKNSLNKTVIKTISFQVETPLLHQTWFRFLMIACALISFIFIWTKYISRKHLREKSKLLNQQKVDGLKLTALQNHMNPHFISNSLFAIQDLLDSDERWEASAFTSKFAELMRHSMLLSSKERISFKEEIEFINKYLNLEKLRFDPPIQYFVNIDNKLLGKQNEIFVPPLLIQPLIENALKHAVFEENKKATIMLNFKLGTDYLTCEVVDNGLDFPDIEGKIIKVGLNSTGLKTVRKRLELNAKQLGYEVETSELLTAQRTMIDNQKMTKFSLQIFYSK